MTALLVLDNIGKQYGGLAANDSISLEVPAGEVFAIIGPNGAGKTTLFNVISGTTAPTSGRVAFDGADITGLPPYAVAERGIIRSFQLVKPFADLTAEQNVAVGFHRNTRGGFLASLVRPAWMRQQEREIDAGARELLEFVGLLDRADVPARELTYGQLRLLEMARALAAKPRLIMLDEPAAGLTPAETESLGGMIRRIVDRGVTVLLIEHDVGLVMKVSARIAVLDFGRKIAEGTPGEIRQHPDVVRAYLGAMDET